MSSSKKNIGISLAVVGFAVAFFFPYDKIQKKDEIKAPTKVSQQLNKTNESKSPAEAAIPQSNLAVQKKREEYNALIVNRLREIRTTNVGSEIKISVRTKPEARTCQSGDFDLIKSVVKDGNEKVFLLSVEKLSGKMAKPAQTRLNIFDIMKGNAFDFALPNQTTAQEYGVFLCLDPQMTGSCNNKEPLATKDWNSAINSAKTPSNMLYFQLMTAKDDRAYLIPTDKWSRPALNELKGKLKTWLNSPDETMEKTASLMSKLGSRSADILGGNLEIPLPYRDPRCDVKASTSPNGRTGGG
ncbi:MAG: hypothetical protein EOP07_12265 [Proteobacteria bacterium]|nr:MAG: hypothetical protein EOP07_12265 [Pseudomonadota bacterium]